MKTTDHIELVIGESYHFVWSTGSYEFKLPISSEPARVYPCTYHGIEDGKHIFDVFFTDSSKPSKHSFYGSNPYHKLSGRIYSSEEAANKRAVKINRFNRKHYRQIVGHFDHAIAYSNTVIENGSDNPGMKRTCWYCGGKGHKFF